MSPSSRRPTDPCNSGHTYIREQSWEMQERARELSAGTCVDANPPLGNSAASVEHWTRETNGRQRLRRRRHINVHIYRWRTGAQCWPEMERLGTWLWIRRQLGFAVVPWPLWAKPTVNALRYTQVYHWCWNICHHHCPFLPDRNSSSSQFGAREKI